MAALDITFHVITGLNKAMTNQYPLGTDTSEHGRPRYYLTLARFFLPDAQT